MPPPVFPSFPGMTFPIRRSPIWSTLQQQSIGGQTPRFAQWSSPRYAYEIPFEVLRRFGAYAEIDQMLGFFNTAYGSANTFAFTDPTDNAVIDQNFGTGTGSLTTFQLVRSFGGFTEPVYLPTGTPTIKVAGVTKATPADYAIGLTGVVTFTAAPANGAALTWTGSFNWLCQFDEDQLETIQFLSNRWSIDALRFTTVKL